MGISDQIKNGLKSSCKGRLSYERETTGPKLKSLLNECSSPPSLHVSPKFSQNLKSHQNETQDERTDTDDETGSRPSLKSNEHMRINNHKVTSPEFGKSRVAVYRFEEEFENRKRWARFQKQKEFEEEQNRIEQEAELKLQKIEQKSNFDMLMKIQNIELRNESQAAEIVKQHRILKETHEHRKQVHDAKIQEAEQEKRKIQEEELRRKDRENRERQEKLAASVAQLVQLHSKITQEFTGSKYSSSVSEPAKKSLSLIQSLVQNAEKIRKDCQQSGEVRVEHFSQVREILDRASRAYELIKKELERVEKEGKEAEAESERQTRIAQEQAAAQATAQTPVQPTTQAETGSTAGSSSASRVTSNELSAAAAARGESLCVDIDAFRCYTELMNKLQEVEQSTAVLSSTPELKKLKFDIQKSVNTAINAISSVSGEHLRDKLKHLLQLLAGQTMDGAGRQFSLNQHPQAPVFCRHLIAKMMVKKAEEQVSCKHESAFAIGMVASGLWRESPSIGDLLLAHFYAQCPYLVPYYMPRQEGQTDEEYFKSRGYKYEGGVVEQHDKFLKRMSGIMRLYFSMIVSAPPRGSHPHGIQHVWIWLTRTLNLDPEPDITATMIYDCLQVTGNKLFTEYKKQFLKLLHIIVKEMLPKLSAVSSNAGSGSLTRLQSLLENSVKHHGSIPPPEGFLDSSFWLS